MSVSQKQAVTNAVLSMFPNYELGGETSLSSIISKDQKTVLRTMLVEGFKADKITLSDEAKVKYINSGDDAALTKYVGGLLDNWIRKNPEFNGGSKYETKNPGSRAGSQDEQVRAMRNLKKTTNDATVLAEIDKAIADRLAEIKPETKVEINVEALPEHLRHLVK